LGTDHHTVIHLDNASPSHTVVVRAKMLSRIDGAPAASGEDDNGRWRSRGLGTRVETLLIGLTKGFSEISGEGLGFFGALAPGFIGLKVWWRWAVKGADHQT
jgi:hypothetical protein